MRIGRLNQRVDIIEITPTEEDQLGGFLTERSVAKTVWARVVAGDGNRLLENQTITNKSPYDFTLRLGAYPLTTENILSFEGYDYTITSIRTDENSRFSFILAWK